MLGADPILEVLEQHAEGRTRPVVQDESLVSHAAKLSRRDGTVDFREPAELVRARINGLSPWPGCDVLLGGRPIRLRRAGPGEIEAPGSVGSVLPDGHVRCGVGSVQLIDVQPPGKGIMSWDAFVRGRGIEANARFEPMQEV